MRVVVTGTNRTEHAVAAPSRVFGQEPAVVRRAAGGGIALNWSSTAARVSNDVDDVPEPYSNGPNLMG